MSNSKIPKKHRLECKGCGETLDMRDPSILSHGWIVNNKIVCYEEKPIEYSSSKKLGDNTQWAVDKKPVHLN